MSYPQHRTKTHLRLGIRQGVKWERRNLRFRLLGLARYSHQSRGGQEQGLPASSVSPPILLPIIPPRASQVLTSAERTEGTPKCCPRSPYQRSRALAAPLVNKDSNRFLPENHTVIYGSHMRTRRKADYFYCGA